MFDATKFNGDKIASDNFNKILECRQILGVYLVKLQYDDSGEEEYIISDTDPTGKILVYKDEDGNTVVMYFSNDVETSDLVDLL